MKVIIVAGAPASGKTAVLLKTLHHIKQCKQVYPSIAKMDCLKSHDASLFRTLEYPVTTGLSGHLCPDHYLATNLNHLYDWALSNQSNTLIIETAGLCNRCAPFLTGALNICVIDSTSSIRSPEKLGPMVTTATIIVMTKCDMISQAEREILSEHLSELNPTSTLLSINGLTGAGSKKLATAILSHSEMKDLGNQTLVYDMPGAICSYCVGERRIGKDYHQGMVEYIDTSTSHPIGG